MNSNGFTSLLDFTMSHEVPAVSQLCRQAPEGCGLRLPGVGLGVSCGIGTPEDSTESEVRGVPMDGWVKARLREVNEMKNQYINNIYIYTFYIISKCS